MEFTQKENAVVDRISQRISITPRVTKAPVIVAMVGLVGSGKSRVASEFGSLLDASVISGDDIRVELRQAGESFEHAWQIGVLIAIKAIQNGSNVILDFDHILAERRTELAKLAEAAAAKLLFIRTHVSTDIMLGRIITVEYENRPEDFFGGAKTVWKGSPQSRGAVVKTREMMRRLPHHYDWFSEGGGTWRLKKLDFPLAAEVDTSELVREDQIRNLVSEFREL
ncbi:MAG: AAA family ATPase [bacterium]|nr:AAA family ATPase [bacterium]